MRRTQPPPPAPGAPAAGDAAGAALANQLFAHGAAKGGMESVDREKINAIVMALAAGSKFTLEKLAHHAAATQWADRAKKALETLDRGQASVHKHHIDAAEKALEQDRQTGVRLGRCCVVVDFDAFYANRSASVELRDRPDLADKPVAVGGIGMITTANYVARQWGVRSAMPGFVGQALCRRGPEFGMPAAELIFLTPDFRKYEAAAKAARAVYSEYDPHVRSMSLDEAYIDLTLYLRARRFADSHADATDRAKRQAKRRRDNRKRGPDASIDPEATAYASDEDGDVDEGGGEGGEKGDVEEGDDSDDAPLDFEHDASAGLLAERVVCEIRARVGLATGGLTLSGGIGPNFMLAKLAADVLKPNGQTRVGAGRANVLAFLDKTPCRKVGGVGRVLEMKLAAVGIHTVGDLRENLVRAMHVFPTQSARTFLLRIALGVSRDGTVGEGDAAAEDEDAPSGAPKGLGNERTFAAISGRGALRSKLEALCEIVSKRLVKHGLKPRRITLKLKNDAFEVRTRTAKAPAPFIQQAKELFDAVEKLLDAELNSDPSMRIRLVGVSTSDFHGVAARPKDHRAIESFFTKPTHAAAGPPQSRTPPQTPRTAAAAWPDEIDPSVLDELPPDIRAEVEAEMRRRAKSPPREAPREAAIWAPPGADDVDDAFLGELPPDVRAEVEAEMRRARAGRRGPPEDAAAAAARQPPAPAPPAAKRRIDSFFTRDG